MQPSSACGNTEDRKRNDDGRADRPGRRRALTVRDERAGDRGPAATDRQPARPMARQGGGSGADLALGTRERTAATGARLTRPQADARAVASGCRRQGSRVWLRTRSRAIATRSGLSVTAPRLRIRSQRRYRAAAARAVVPRCMHTCLLTAGDVRGPGGEGWAVNSGAVLALAIIGCLAAISTMTVAGRCASARRLAGRRAPATRSRCPAPRSRHCPSSG